MKRELIKHLSPLAVFFVITSIVWIFTKVSVFQFAYLFFGLLWGSFFLDLDHLIYWFYSNPNLEESKLARIAISKRDYISTLKILESTHKNHTSLIFHHVIFQIILLLVSFFVFTSNNMVFGQGFLLAINTHLLVDEIDDYRISPPSLQNWLFARMNRQLSVKSLKPYLIAVTVTTIFFALLLIKSNA